MSNKRQILCVSTPSPHPSPPLSTGRGQEAPGGGRLPAQGQPAADLPTPGHPGHLKEVTPAVPVRHGILFPCPVFGMVASGMHLSNPPSLVFLFISLFPAECSSNRSIRVPDTTVAARPITIRRFLTHSQTVPCRLSGVLTRLFAFCVFFW